MQWTTVTWKWSDYGFIQTVSGSLQYTNIPYYMG